MVPVAVHPAELSPAQLLEACDVRRTRRSGPGGQHRNKVETAVVITHQPTGVKGEASERRSQSQNHRNAVFRLRVNLALSVRCRREPPDSPSPLWRSRCAGGRICISPQHDDFPALLAEALDALAACEMDVKSAAAMLQITSSQLTRFLQLEPLALAQVNAHRQDLGRRPLR
jgi:hypothetical protein